MAKLPTMIKVPESSNIAEIGYNEEKQKLYIQFKEGGLYSYHPVTPKQWKEMQKAESKGSYFWKNIRNNKSITTKQL